MKSSQMFTVAILTGGLIAFSGVHADAQHSSGGTPPGVTEGSGSGSGDGMGSGSSGAGMGSDGSGSETGRSRGSSNQQKHPSTSTQAGSQGQQGMKGSGSPMEHDKSSKDKLIYDEGKAMEKN